MEFIGMIATWEFCVFLLGIIGVAFFMRVHQVITKCNPKTFGIICTIIAYLVITHIQSM